MSQPLIEAAFLNIVATPHPAGVYLRLLRRCSKKPVPYWGAHRAAITAPIRARDESGFLVFTLFLWMEVNPDEPAIDKTALEKANFPAEGKEFTKKYGVNGRAFACVFDPTIHLLTVEIKNSDGKSVSVDMLHRIFTYLLSPEILGKDAEEVEVTVVPADGAIAHVLGIDRLDRVEILVKRPNPDDLTSQVNRVLNRLETQNIKSEKRILIRQAKTDGIVLNEDNLTLATVGARNGYVKSAGVDEGGDYVKRSTKNIPHIVRHAVEKGASFVAALRGIAREARDNHEQL